MSQVKRPQMLAGFVLHHRPYRDSSLTLDIFTREAGRLALVARGARRPKARQRALLQPFRPLRLSWRMGAGDMGSLTDVEADGAPLNPAGDRLLSAFYLNELILRLAGRHDPLPDLFDCYDGALRGLSSLPEDSDRGVAMILRRFEKQALDCLGYGLPTLDVCLDGSPVVADGLYRFDPQAGAYPLASVSEPRGEERGIPGSVLLALARDDWSESEFLPQIRRVMAAALSPHLGDRPMKTAQVLRDLRRRRGRTSSPGRQES